MGADVPVAQFVFLHRTIGVGCDDAVCGIDGGDEGGFPYMCLTHACVAGECEAGIYSGGGKPCCRKAGVILRHSSGPHTVRNLGTECLRKCFPNGTRECLRGRVPNFISLQYTRIFAFGTAAVEYFATVPTPHKVHQHCRSRLCSVAPDYKPPLC